MEIKYKPTYTDQLILAFALIVMLTMSAFCVYGYYRLPDSIPTHFGINGEPDAWGSKKTIFLLPVIGWVTFGLMALFMNTRGGGKYIYTFHVRPENREKFDAITARAMRVTMLTVSILFGFLTAEIYLIGMGHTEAFGPWSIIPSLFIVLGPITYYTIQAYRLK